MGLFSKKRNNKHFTSEHSKPEYRKWSYSVQGLRDTQEDSYIIMEDTEGQVLGMVADGVGGYPHGEFASATVVDIFKNTFVQAAEFGSIESFIRKTLLVSATMIMQQGMIDPLYKDAATTVSGFVVDKRTKIYTFNVGDSRVYLIRQNDIKRLTKDHSLVQELIDSGQITRDEAFNHPQKNILTNILRASLSDLKIDVRDNDFLLPGDILLATTDGVHDYLKDNEILEIIGKAMSDENPAQILVQKALEKGSKDNITAVICQRII